MGTLLDEDVREDCSENQHFSKELNDEMAWEADRWNSKCKGPGAWTGLLCLRSSMRASAATVVGMLQVWRVP